MPTRFVTIATHSERYYPLLIQSAKRHNIEFDAVLGWGKEYTGHYMKDDLMIEYLTNVSKEVNNRNGNQEAEGPKKFQDDLIIFVDGFDSVFLTGQTEFENKYQKLCETLNDNNDILLVSRDFDPDYNNPIKANYYASIFKKCDGCYTNAGLFMGTAKLMLDFLLKAKSYRDPNINSNQVVWQKCYLDHQNKNKDHPIFMIDRNADIFFNFCESNSIKQLGVKIAKNQQNGNKRVYLNITNTYPCVISGPGTAYLDKIISNLDYQIKEPQSVIDKYLGYIKKVPYYLNFFYSHIAVLIGLILFVIIIWYFFLK